MNKLIVVLGMHRSGTSAITRSLKVMGIDLGDNMIPPVEGNNPKGFWEDIDISALNIEMLHALSSDWHYLTFIDAVDVETLRSKGFFLRAVDLIRKKIGRAPSFGFKDPRVAKLLPFWKEVINYCQFDASYILAIRHPRSVVKSLIKRDCIEESKGYFLWLGHVIASLMDSSGQTRVVVDYDLLMHSPDHELERIAQNLDLEINDAELQIYKKEFLDHSLRHTIYQLSDLMLDDACPPLVYEIYTKLLEIATDQSQIDNPTFQEKIEQWAAEFIRIKSALQLADRLCSQREAAVQSLAECDDQVANLKQAVTERDDQVANLKQAVTERDDQVSDLNQRLSKLGADISQLNHCLSRVYASNSWRITAPLRQLRRVVSSAKGPYPIEGKAFRLARNIFRNLPISSSAKNKLRFWVIARSGVFNGFQPCATLKHKMVIDNEGEIDTGHSDYMQFKQQLIKRLADRRSGWQPSRKRMLSYDNNDLLSIACSISFNLDSNPKVTILIPVYGNAALTIECLASIKKANVTTSYEILIADDASKDQTPELLNSINGIKIHTNRINQGFLKNCNAALPLATGEYVVYLNNDVQVTDGWLDRLIDVFSEFKNTGAVGPKIVYPSGYLQEAGVALKHDGTADMIGLNDNPAAPRFEYIRPVDYCSGACLMIRRELLEELGGFSDEFAPAYCEDADLCLRIIERGYKIYYTHRATLIHHLSKTTAADGLSRKIEQVSVSLAKLQRKWAKRLDILATVKVIAFYLPQFHAIPENNLWWGQGFTEWTNVKKAQPNFEGHFQPRVPADLGFYDLRDEKTMIAQVELAQRYGIDGFCFYYYWFNGKKLLEMPLERILRSGNPDFSYCLCWANENWSRRWDGRDSEILIGQQHSPEDDRAVILDLIRHFNNPNYIRIDGRPHIIVYRVDLFPDFFETSRRWRETCREQGVGEIYISLVESHDLVHKKIHPSTYGCDASIEFPPLNMAEQIPPSGKIINPDFHGGVADYRDTALRYCSRELPAYTRFRGAMPGWDNTARRQNNGFCFEHASPEVFQAWLEHIIWQTRQQHHGDERIVFINAWNEWAEGAYLEPDTRHGHAFLEAVKNAKDSERLLKNDH